MLETDDKIFLLDDEELFVESFPLGPLECNCTIIICRNTGEAAVIDPGGNTERIDRTLADCGATLRWILHTHAHFDHCATTTELFRRHASETPVIALHTDELEAYNSRVAMARRFGIAMDPDSVEIARFLKDGDRITVGQLKLEVLHTPGHSRGSLCFYLRKQQLIVVGDLIFYGSIGRTDLPGGDFETIQHSIRERIYSLPDETRIIPGHGPITTPGREKFTNAYVRI